MCVRSYICIGWYWSKIEQKRKSVGSKSERNAGRSEVTVVSVLWSSAGEGSLGGRLPVSRARTRGAIVNFLMTQHGTFRLFIGLGAWALGQGC